MVRPLLLLAVTGVLAALVLQPVAANHCATVTVVDTITHGQVKDPGLRIGRLIALQGEGALGATELTYRFIASPGTGAFTLQAQDVGFDLCEDADTHSADFDITFFSESNGIDTPLQRYDICGNEAGTVPAGTDFAIVWLTAPSLPAQTFTYSTCHDV